MKRSFNCKGVATHRLRTIDLSHPVEKTDEFSVERREYMEKWEADGTLGRKMKDIDSFPNPLISPCTRKPDIYTCQNFLF